MDKIICKKIKEELNKQKADCLIVPPYCWGVNHYTGAFPGTFSLKPDKFQLNKIAARRSVKAVAQFLFSQ